MTVVEITHQRFQSGTDFSTHRVADHGQRVGPGRRPRKRGIGGGRRRRRRCARDWRRREGCVTSGTPDVAAIPAKPFGPELRRCEGGDTHADAAGDATPGAGRERSVAGAMADSDVEGAPITTSAVLISASKHISSKCGAQNRAFLDCKRNDPNPEKCLQQGQNVTRCVISL